MQLESHTNGSGRNGVGSRQFRRRTRRASIAFRGGWSQSRRCEVRRSGFQPSNGVPHRIGSPVNLERFRPEFVSRAILKWLAGANIDTAHIDPGKAWQTATNESFNDKFRDECLSLAWFRSRQEARVLIESWRRHDNEVRPHSSLGYLTPRQLINQSIDESNGTVLQSSVVRRNQAGHTLLLDFFRAMGASQSVVHDRE